MKMIPDISKWVQWGYGDIDYFLKQALKGHGEFGKYIQRFRCRKDPSCILRRTGQCIIHDKGIAGSEKGTSTDTSLSGTTMLRNGSSWEEPNIYP